MDIGARGVERERERASSSSSFSMLKSTHTGVSQTCYQDEQCVKRHPCMYNRHYLKAASVIWCVLTCKGYRYLMKQVGC